jgi:hypothetical protein
VTNLCAVPCQQWPELRLLTHPAVEIVQNEWRVTDVLSAVESGRQWSEPAPQKATVIVWRQDAQVLVYYRDLEDAEARALALLSQGARFAAICEVIAALATGPDHVALIGRLLAKWLADGIIAATDAMPRDNDARSMPPGGLQDDRRFRRNVIPCRHQNGKVPSYSGQAKCQRSHAADSSNRSGATENSRKQPAYSSKCTALMYPMRSLCRRLRRRNCSHEERSGRVGGHAAFPEDLAQAILTACRETDKARPSRREAGVRAPQQRWGIEKEANAPEDLGHNPS